MGAAALTAAVILRLCAGGLPGALGYALGQPETASFLAYLYTGRSVRLSAPVPGDTAQPTEETPGVGQGTQERTLPSFTAGDAALTAVTDSAGLQPDLGALLERPLSWDLRDGAPRVLILHTHTTESYTPMGEGYTETSAYRTLDPEHNMLWLGDLVTDLLEQAGIGVVHDRTVHDYPSYNGSYAHAATSVEALLEQYPTVELVLDLHRDAADTPYGQLVTGCTLDGEQSAQLMFVVGAAVNYSQRPDWEENLSLALKLQVLLERENPGITRKTQLAAQRYNQHLGSRALILEIGAAGNTLEEAEKAARCLADAVIALSKGASPD